MFSEETSKELKRMGIFILGMTAVMIGVFALCGYFDMTVVLGGVLGAVAAFLNFFFLALAVEKAVKNGNNPKAVAASSYTLRMLFLAAVIILAIKLPYFNYIATIIPLVFPRITIFILELTKKRDKK